MGNMSSVRKSEVVYKVERTPDQTTYVWHGKKHFRPPQNPAPDGQAQPEESDQDSCPFCAGVVYSNEYAEGQPDKAGAKTFSHSASAKIKVYHTDKESHTLPKNFNMYSYEEELDDALKDNEEFYENLQQNGSVYEFSEEANVVKPSEGKVLAVKGGSSKQNGRAFEEELFPKLGPADRAASHHSNASSSYVGGSTPGNSTGDLHQDLQNSNWKEENLCKKHEHLKQWFRQGGQHSITQIAEFRKEIDKLIAKKENGVSKGDSGVPSPNDSFEQDQKVKDTSSDLDVTLAGINRMSSRDSGLSSGMFVSPTAEKQHQFQSYMVSDYYATPSSSKAKREHELSHEEIFEGIVEKMDSTPDDDLEAAFSTFDKTYNQMCEENDLKKRQKVRHSSMEKEYENINGRGQIVHTLPKASVYPHYHLKIKDVPSAETESKFVREGSPGSSGRVSPEIVMENILENAGNEADDFHDFFMYHTKVLGRPVRKAEVSYSVSKGVGIGDKSYVKTRSKKMDLDAEGIRPSSVIIEELDDEKEYVKEEEKEPSPPAIPLDTDSTVEFSTKDNVSVADSLKLEYSTLERKSRIRPEAYDVESVDKKIVTDREEIYQDDIRMEPRKTISGPVRLETEQDASITKVKTVEEVKVEESPKPGYGTLEKKKVVSPTDWELESEDGIICTEREETSLEDTVQTEPRKQLSPPVRLETEQDVTTTKVEQKDNVTERSTPSPQYGTLEKKKMAAPDDWELESEDGIICTEREEAQVYKDFDEEAETKKKLSAPIQPVHLENEKRIDTAEIDTEKVEEAPAEEYSTLTRKDRKQPTDYYVASPAQLPDDSGAVGYKQGEPSADIVEESAYEDYGTLTKEERLLMKARDERKKESMVLENEHDDEYKFPSCDASAVDIPPYQEYGSLTRKDRHMPPEEPAVEYLWKVLKDGKNTYYVAEGPGDITDETDEAVVSKEKIQPKEYEVESDEEPVTERVQEMYFDSNSLRARKGRGRDMSGEPDEATGYPRSMTFPRRRKDDEILDFYRNVMLDEEKRLDTVLQETRSRSPPPRGELVNQLNSIEPTRDDTGTEADLQNYINIALASIHAAKEKIEHDTKGQGLYRPGAATTLPRPSTFPSGAKRVDPFEMSKPPAPEEKAQEAYYELDPLHPDNVDLLIASLTTPAQSPDQKDAQTPVKREESGIIKGSPPADKVCDDAEGSEPCIATEHLESFQSQPDKSPKPIKVATYRTPLKEKNVSHERTEVIYEGDQAKSLLRRSRSVSIGSKSDLSEASDRLSRENTPPLQENVTYHRTTSHPPVSELDKLSQVINDRLTSMPGKENFQVDAEKALKRRKLRKPKMSMSKPSSKIIKDVAMFKKAIKPHDPKEGELVCEEIETEEVTLTIKYPKGLYSPTEDNIFRDIIHHRVTKIKGPEDENVTLTAIEGGKDDSQEEEKIKAVGSSSQSSQQVAPSGVGKRTDDDEFPHSDYQEFMTKNLKTSADDAGGSSVVPPFENEHDDEYKVPSCAASAVDAPPYQGWGSLTRETRPAPKESTFTC